MQGGGGGGGGGEGQIYFEGPHLNEMTLTFKAPSSHISNYLLYYFSEKIKHRNNSHVMFIHIFSEKKKKKIQNDYDAFRVNVASFWNRKWKTYSSSVSGLNSAGSSGYAWKINNPSVSILVKVTIRMHNS